MKGIERLKDIAVSVVRWSPSVISLLAREMEDLS